ncbi:hypothetical protein MMIC_P2189 [Mariprofundus micogutta]|uniref:Uncharacterized protein n=1 Tax=Mariprofundus micogutta TaxID=1921010 RepID=A0A1L8CQW8_9PROT|nr:hypothetical protein MMIC_P2189 [Mariprofundus micogutta]
MVLRVKQHLCRCIIQAHLMSEGEDAGANSTLAICLQAPL